MGEPMKKWIFFMRQVDLFDYTRGAIPEYYPPNFVLALFQSLSGVLDVCNWVRKDCRKNGLYRFNPFQGF